MNSKKNIVAFACTFLMMYCNSFVRSQSVSETDSVDNRLLQIFTDRPSQNETAQLIPRGWFQLETGAQKEFFTDRIHNIKYENTILNTTLWKYGLSENFELRIVTEFGEDKVQFKSEENRDSTSICSGLKPLSVGSKIAIQKERGIIPEIGLITHLSLPYFASDSYRQEFTIPGFRFLFNHTLNENFSFSYNLGAEWENGTNAATGIYTACLDVSPIRRLSFFLEAYGFLKEKFHPDHRVDAGVTWLLTNNMQLDVSGGAGLSKTSPDYFVSCGFSFRLKTIKPYNF